MSDTVNEKPTYYVMFGPQHVSGAMYSWNHAGPYTKANAAVQAKIHAGRYAGDVKIIQAVAMVKVNVTMDIVPFVNEE